MEAVQVRHEEPRVDAGDVQGERSVYNWAAHALATRPRVEIYLLHRDLRDREVPFEFDDFD